MKKIAGLAVLALGIVYLIVIFRLYVRDNRELLFFFGWVIIYSILWAISIYLRSQKVPEARGRARVISLIIFIPIAAYVVQSLSGGQNQVIEMAAAISVYGLFLSWGSRLFLNPI